MKRELRGTVEVKTRSARVEKLVKLNIFWGEMKNKSYIWSQKSQHLQYASTTFG